MPVETRSVLTHEVVVTMAVNIPHLGAFGPVGALLGAVAATAGALVPAFLAGGLASDLVDLDAGDGVGILRLG